MLLVGLWWLIGTEAPPTAPDPGWVQPHQETVVRERPAVATAPKVTPTPALNTTPPPSRPARPALPLIALIIDDVGYRLDIGKRCIELPGDVTLAFLPFSPHTRTLAAQAAAAGKEIMLHAPMQPSSAIRWEGGLTSTMDREAVGQTLSEMLRQLPQAKGVNNHMGSGLTQNRQIMDWVMQELQQKRLYFIDSRTSAQSQAFPAALSRALPSAKRDVFLDNERTPEAIAAQFAHLVKTAHKNGFAVGIGHPYPETLAFLEQVLPQLEQHQVQLVPVSRLLALVQDPQRPRHITR